MNTFKLLLFLGLFNLAHAQNCIDETYKLNQGLELFSEGQYLLSSIHFISADSADCKNPEITERAKVGYLFSIHQLGERSESFRISTQLETSLSPRFKKQIRGFRSFYYDVASDSEFELRKSMFENWKLQRRGPKNPWIAGGLSTILPGAGQFYTGAYQSAAVAFTLNVLFYSATAELQRKGLQSTSLASGLIFSIVYLGNILNAANSTKIYNENFHRKETEDYTRTQFPELSP